MIYSTATVPVNPQGETALTRDQLWQGLVLKARDARLFLPPGACTKCDVVVDAKDYLIREATIMGDDLSEIVYIDHYGNACTGLFAADLSHDASIAIEGTAISYASTFSAGPPGKLFWYANSLGLVEISVGNGNAAQEFDLRIGQAISVMAGMN